MGRRTGKEPTADDSFVWRICHALDQTPGELAANMGVHPEELEPLLKGGSSELVDVDMDDAWYRLADYVARQIGTLMTIRREMNVKLQKDRTKRASRMERFKKYHAEH